MCIIFSCKGYYQHSFDPGEGLKETLDEVRMHILYMCVCIYHIISWNNYISGSMFVISMIAITPLFSCITVFLASHVENFNGISPWLCFMYS